MLLPENVALALAVAEVIGIEEEVALRGMLQANPDPGAMRIKEVQKAGNIAQFVNGFAANDPIYTINIWNNVVKQGYPAELLIVIMTCRDDRVDRTIQFSEDVLPNLPIATLVLIGTRTEPVKEAVRRGTIQVNQVLDMQGEKTE